MVGVVLVGHGMLGEAVIATLRTVLGHSEGIEAVTCSPQDTAEDIHGRITRAVAKVDAGDGVVILTDMLGDTQTNQSVVVARATGAEVLAGVNVPMVIKLIEERGRMQAAPLARLLQRYGQEHIFWVTGPGSRGDV